MTARRAAFLLILLLVTACAPRVPTLPSGGGVPFPDFSTAHVQAAQGCASVSTFSAVLSLSGRVGGQKLRGRVDAGLAAPDRIVLEAVAPFGKPFFVLASAAGDATLLLPRDGRYLRDATAEAIVEALTGVALTPEELRLALAGCGIPAAVPSSGRSFDGGWAAIDSGETTTWLRQIDGRWRIAAATRGTMTVHYDAFGPERPATVRIRVTTGAGADLIARLSDVAVNAPIDAKAFALDVPRDATPITLDELRRGGPLSRQ